MSNRFDPYGDLIIVEAVLHLFEGAKAYLDTLNVVGEDDRADLFYHALAIMHSPRYRAENGGALRQDWARIPLPSTAEALKASGALGRQLAVLLDAECGVESVTEKTA